MQVQGSGTYGSLQVVTLTVLVQMHGQVMHAMTHTHVLSSTRL